MNKIVRAISLIHWRSLGARMKTHFGKFFANRTESRNVIVVRVSDEKMPKDQLVLLDHVQDRLRVPTSIEQRCFARDFVPDKITIYRDVLSGARERSQLAPTADILFGWVPAIGDPFELRGVKPDQIRKRNEIGTPGGLSGIFNRSQFRKRKSCRAGGGFGCNIRHRSRFANDVAHMVFQIHRRTP
jgi:hypothetical protein